jgi:hypothetical protein
MFSNSKEVHVMAARFNTMQQHPNCCTTSAAACTSAHYGLILDTVVLAVSIIIVLILGLLGGIS